MPWRGPQRLGLSWQLIEAGGEGPDEGRAWTEHPQGVSVDELIRTSELVS